MFLVVLLMICDILLVGPSTPRSKSAFVRSQQANQSWTYSVWRHPNKEFAPSYHYVQALKYHVLSKGIHLFCFIVFNRARCLRSFILIVSGNIKTKTGLWTLGIRSRWKMFFRKSCHWNRFSHTSNINRETKK